MKDEDLARRHRIVASAPPFEELLRGSVFVRKLRCGTPTCHCAKAEGHRVAYLSVTLTGGRTEQISLPAHLVPLAKKWVRNYAKWWLALEKISAINRKILRADRDRDRKAGGRARRKTGRR